jgi:lysophospholipase L1-like esterase
MAQHNDIHDIFGSLGSQPVSSSTPKEGKVREVVKTIFLPDDSSIQYTGRIDKSNRSAYTFSYCGVTIHTAFYGSFIEAEFTEYGNGSAGGTNYFNVIIDGELQEKPLRLQPGKHVYTLAENLSEGAHTIELFKRTESQVGAVAFHGFVTDISGEKLPIANLPELKLEFVGNSITCGYGNEMAFTVHDLETQSGFNSLNENNYMAYGAITARNLQAQYSCIAYSGRGLYQNNTGSSVGTVPKIYDRIFPDNPQSVWTAEERANYTPHYIVVNLGSNDFYAETSLGTQFYVEREKFINAYIAFVNTLRTYYPQATIICAVGVMMSNNAPEGAQQWTRIQEHVQAVCNHFVAKGDNKVMYLKFEPHTAPYGEDWHPSIATHQKMAERLTEFILNDSKTSK